MGCSKCRVELKNHHLSVGQLQETRLAILIQSNQCKIYHPSRGLIIQTNMTATRMFILLSEITNKQPKEEVCLQAKTKDLAQLWHRRYGHLSYKGLKTLQLKEMVRGLPKLFESNDVCTLSPARFNYKTEHMESIPKIRTCSCRLMWTNLSNLQQP